MKRSSTTPIAPPPAEPLDRVSARREAILDAAAKLFAERGYSETDTQELADALGIGKGTLYRYFPSKRELFLAAADRVMRRLRAQVDAQVQATADPIARIGVGIRAFLTYCHANPEFVELLMQERAQFKDRKKPTYFIQREEYLAFWHSLYRDLIAAGRLRDVPPQRLTDVIGSLLYGTLFTHYFGASSKGVEEQVVDILDVLHHGILSPAERRKHPRPEPAGE